MDSMSDEFATSLNEGFFCCPSCDYESTSCASLKIHIEATHGEEESTPTERRQRLSYKSERFVDLGKRRQPQKRRRSKQPPVPKVRPLVVCQSFVPPPPPVILSVQSLQTGETQSQPPPPLRAPSDEALSSTIDDVISSLCQLSEANPTTTAQLGSDGNALEFQVSSETEELLSGMESLLVGKSLEPMESVPNVWSSVPEPFTDAVAAVCENRMSSYAAAFTFKVKRNSLRKHLSDTFNRLKNMGIVAVFSASHNRYLFYECPELVAQMEVLGTMDLSRFSAPHVSPSLLVPTETRSAETPPPQDVPQLQERIFQAIVDLKVECPTADYPKRLIDAVSSVIDKTKSVGIAAGHFVVEASVVVDVVVFLCKNWSDVQHWCTHVYSHLSYEEFRHLVYSYPFKVAMDQDEMERNVEGLYAASATGANLRWICERYRLMYPRLYHMMRVLQSKAVLKNKRIVGPLSETRFFKKLRGEKKKLPPSKRRSAKTRNPKNESAIDLEVARKVNAILSSVAHHRSPESAAAGPMIPKVERPASPELSERPAQQQIVATPQVAVPNEAPTKLTELKRQITSPSPKRSPRPSGNSTSSSVRKSSAAANLLSVTQETTLVNFIKCLRQANLPVPGEFVIEVASELCKTAGGRSPQEISNFFTRSWLEEFNKRF